jgi:hypothetical protein
VAAPAGVNPRGRAALVGAAAWAVIVVVSVGLGRWLIERDVHIVLPTPPVLGAPVGASVLGLAGAAVVGAVLVFALPRVTARLTWRRMLLAAAVASLVWWVGLALAEGTSGLVRGPNWWTEYLHDVPAVRDDPARFLRTFTDDIDRYEIHVRGHPPGMVLLLAGLDAVGLGGPRWEAAFVLGAASTAPVAVLLALRDVAGEATARRAAPFLAVAPAAIWIATSADALYMALAAWAVAGVVLATSRMGARSVALAIAGGLLGGAALLGSYGMVLAGAIPAATAWRRRRWVPVAVAVGAAVAVLLALVPFGFWWLDGLAATRHEYETLDIDRPYAAFLVLNLGAWALALGPATVAGLARLRDRSLWALAGGGLAAAAIANLSGLSEGEVERIWLPFGLWVLPAAVSLATPAPSPELVSKEHSGLCSLLTSSRTRLWLAAQIATALVIVGCVRTQW